MTFCIVAIFKNESAIMEEWLNHYIKEGCSKFLLIDNGSTDNYLPILKKYRNMVVLAKDLKKHAQEELYNKCFLKAVQYYKWTIVCDLDEFIYSRKKFRTIKDFLNSIDNNVSQISIPWKIFGSNGYNTLDKKEPKSAIAVFTKRMFYDKKSGFQGVHEIKGNIKMDLCKSIARSDRIKRIKIHDHELHHDFTIDSNYQRQKSGVFTPCNETILNSANLHLNHYAIQSFAWFKRVKMTRGDASSAHHENTRTDNYFHEFDMLSNDIDDFELKNKKY